MRKPSTFATVFGIPVGYRSTLTLSGLLVGTFARRASSAADRSTRARLEARTAAPLSSRVTGSVRMSKFSRPTRSLATLASAVASAATGSFATGDFALFAPTTMRTRSGNSIRNALPCAEFFLPLRGAVSPHTRFDDRRRRAFEDGRYFVVVRIVSSLPRTGWRFACQGGDVLARGSEAVYFEALTS